MTHLDLSQSYELFLASPVGLVPSINKDPTDENSYPMTYKVIYENTTYNTFHLEITHPYNDQEAVTLPCTIFFGPYYAHIPTLSLGRYLFDKLIKGEPALDSDYYKDHPEILI